MAESKDYIVRNQEDGSVSISEDVIAIIAWEAMHEVEGFGAPSAGFSGELAELIGRKNASRGVRITTTEGSVSVDVYITVRYGYSVTKVGSFTKNRGGVCRPGASIRRRCSSSLRSPRSRPRTGSWS